MTQDNKKKLTESNNYNALIKHKNNDSVLTTQSGKSLLTLTNTILKSALKWRQSNQLPTDDSWMDQIWCWADKLEISEDKIPRNKDDLMKLTELNEPIRQIALHRTESLVG